MLAASRFSRVRSNKRDMMKIQCTLDVSLMEAVEKCREKALNSPILRAYLSSAVKNIIGKTGFSLQTQVKKADGSLDSALNDSIEWAWYDFGKLSNGFLTVDGGLGHNDFDALILRTLLVDGEVFIRIHHPASHPYGLSFELIDSLSIDYTKRHEFSNGTACVLGIEIDERWRPLKYYIKKGTTTVYQAGKEEEVPASEIIHIFKKERAEQTRGIPPFSACYNALEDLDEYRDYELLAAKVSSVENIFYERNGMGVQGDFISQQEQDDKGAFMQDIESFTASIVPTGYNVKTLTPTHPNNGFGEFTKSVLTQVAASLGVSYAKLLKDYGAVNYSSLREGTLDEAAFYAEQQSFLIEAWKEIEFKLFIEALALSSDIIKPSQVKDILMHHTWVCQKRAYFDKGKDILGDERELKLGLKSPLMLMEANGDDPEEIMRSWKQYETMCNSYGLSFPVTEKDAAPTQEESFDDEAAQNEELNKARG